MVVDTHIQLYCQHGDPSTKTTLVIKKTLACLAVACILNIRHFVSLVAKGKGPSRMRGLREPVCSRRAARCGTKKLSGPESAELLCRGGGGGGDKISASTVPNDGK